jgi:hypothetical protein
VGVAIVYSVALVGSRDLVTICGGVDVGILALAEIVAQRSWAQWDGVFSLLYFKWRVAYGVVGVVKQAIQLI